MYRSRIEQSLMLSQHSNKLKRLVYNGGVSKVRIDNSVVPNFVMKVTKATQKLGNMG